MGIRLDHTIVPAKDRWRLAVKPGYFAQAPVNESLTGA
jgi:hypothetical protein